MPEEDPSIGINQKVKDKGRRANGRGNSISRGSEGCNTKTHSGSLVKQSSVKYMRRDMSREAVEPWILQGDTGGQIPQMTQLTQSNSLFLKTPLNTQWMMNECGESYWKATVWTNNGKRWRGEHGCERNLKGEANWLCFPGSCMGWPQWKVVLIVEWGE